MENNNILDNFLHDKDFNKIWNAEHMKEKKTKALYKHKLKGLINVRGLWRHLNEDLCWFPVGIVTIRLTDEKRSGYATYQHARVDKILEYSFGNINDFDAKDTLLYMQQYPDDRIRGVDHYYVWQTSGYMGDDYSGYLLYPLSNGTYFKVSYSC